MFGFGSEGVKSVFADERRSMKPAELGRTVAESFRAGETHLFVNRYDGAGLFRSAGRQRGCVREA